MRVKIASSRRKTGRIFILLVSFLLVAGLLPASARHVSTAGHKHSASSARSKSKKSSANTRTHTRSHTRTHARTQRGKSGRGKKSHARVSSRHNRHGAAHVSTAHHPGAPRPTLAKEGEAPADTQFEPRRRNYALLSQAYSLYDRGAAQRLSGDFGESVENLSRSYAILEQARSHQKDNKPSTLESMVLFELAQAAESDGDMTLARDSYSRCLIASPRFAEAYLRVCDLLARQGNLPLALKFAADGVANCPEDARISQLNEMLASRLNKAEQ